jgi:hypothetical protein
MIVRNCAAGNPLIADRERGGSDRYCSCGNSKISTSSRNCLCGGALVHWRAASKAGLLLLPWSYAASPLLQHDLTARVDGSGVLAVGSRHRAWPKHRRPERALVRLKVSPSSAH